MLKKFRSSCSTRQLQDRRYCLSSKNKILFGGGTTFAARADILKDLSIPDEVDMYIDEYLILGTMANGYTYFIEEPLSVWRIHGNNYSKANNSRSASDKNKRLVNSSKGVLDAIQKLNVPANVKKIYKLQHAIRNLTAMEQADQKTILDIFKFLLFMVSSGYSVRTLARHSAINRLLPTRLLLLLKSKS